MTNPYLMSAGRSKMIMSAFVVALFGGVGFTHIYLPHFSSQANDRRHRDALDARRAQHAAQAAKRGPNGNNAMWKALNDRTTPR